MIQQQCINVKLTGEGLAIDRAWTDEEYADLAVRISENTGSGYYHQVRIIDPSGIVIETPGTHPTAGVIKLLDQAGFPANFEGKTVLDIGCNSGFYSIVCKLRGASKVVGVDHQPHYIEQAKMIREILGLTDEELELRVADGHDFEPGAEQFDFVINTGVVYHLQNPMDFLVRAASVTRGTMFLESEMLTDPNYSEHAWFIENSYGADPTNWWIYGPQCLERMARAAGFRQVEFKGFIWKPAKGEKTPEGYPRQGRGVLLCQK